MATVNRQVVESPLEQGEDEEIIYQLTTTPWGSTPTSIAVVVKDESDNSDVSDDVLTGSASASGDVITLPKISGLTALTNYRVEVKFTAAGNVWEPYFILKAVM